MTNKKIKRIEVNDNFTKVPNLIITTTQLSTTQKLLIMFLMSHKDNYDVSINFIRKGINMKWEIVDKNYKSLVEMGIIVEDGDYIQLNLDLLHSPKKENLSNKKSNTPSPKKENPFSKKGEGSSPKKENNNTNNNINKQDSITPFLFEKENTSYITPEAGGKQVEVSISNYSIKDEGAVSISNSLLVKEFSTNKHINEGKGVITNLQLLDYFNFFKFPEDTSYDNKIKVLNKIQENRRLIPNYFNHEQIIEIYVPIINGIIRDIFNKKHTSQPSIKEEVIDYKF